MGVPVLNNALDCWIYQEILVEVQPQIIVELGSRTGGTHESFWLQETVQTLRCKLRWLPCAAIVAVWWCTM